MAAVRTVEELSSNPEFEGYYDYEEAKKQELEDAKAYAIEQGKKEANIEIAKNLLELDISMDKIYKATKLTQDEINALK